MTVKQLGWFFIAAILGASCSQHASQEAGKDTAADSLENKGYSKIVTLNGTLTEIVASAGFLDRIAGVDGTSIYPEEVNKLPKVGHGMNIQAEGIVSLAPDLVLGNKGALNQEVEAQLRLANTELKLFDELTYTVDGADHLIREVTKTLGAPEKGEALIEQMHNDLKEVQPFEQKPKVLFIYARGAGTLMVAGEKTQMQALIELAGAENAVKGFENFMPLTPESLVAANPDAVLLFNTGVESLNGLEGVKQIPGMAQTTAGKSDAFIAMDAALLSNFGPRLGVAAKQLNSELHKLKKRD